MTGTTTGHAREDETIYRAIDDNNKIIQDSVLSPSSRTGAQSPKKNIPRGSFGAFKPVLEQK